MGRGKSSGTAKLGQLWHNDRRQNDRRRTERRGSNNICLVSRDRRNSERRQSDRRGEEWRKEKEQESERRKRRLKSFKRDQERKRFQRALKKRLQQRIEWLEKAIRIQRIKQAWAKKACISQREGERARLARGVAMTYRLDVTRPASSTLILWQNEVESMKKSIKAGVWDSRHTKKRLSSKRALQIPSHFNKR